MGPMVLRSISCRLAGACLALLTLAGVLSAGAAPDQPMPPAGEAAAPPPRPASPALVRPDFVRLERQQAETDRAWAEALALGDRLRLLPYAPRSESLALQRDSEALLLLIPEAGGRGKGVLSGKVFEYVAVGRPILAVVPPVGAAAELIRATGAGVVAAPEDVGEIRSALEELHRRWQADGLPDVALTEEWRDRLSRRTRVEEMATVLRDTLA
jgi:glycosyltransferase involved in cell wall biosynthesis